MASYDTIAAGVAAAPQHDHEKHELQGVGNDYNNLEHVETAGTTKTTDADGNALLFDENGAMRLLPAPTPDPRDPLNMTRGQKFLAIGCLCFFGAMAAAAEIILGAMLPVFVLVYANIDVRWIVVFTTFGGLKAGTNPLEMLNDLPGAVPIWKIYLLASLPVLMMGIANFILVPAAIAVGRRAIIILCGVLAIAGAVWAGFSQSLGEHLAARCLQALGAGTVESLIPFILQDIVYFHQRNSAISVVFAIQGLLIVGLGIATPYMIIYLSWRWVYWITASAAGFFLFGVILFLPETRWHRSKDEMNGIPAAPRHTRKTLSVPNSNAGSDSEGTLTPHSDSGSGAPLGKRKSAVGKAWQGFLNTTRFGEEEEANPQDPDWVWRQERKEEKEKKAALDKAAGKIKNQFFADRSHIDHVNYEPRTFAYNLALWHGKMEWSAGWQAMIATLRTFFYPHIFFITMLNSSMIAAALAAGYTVAPALLTAPYSWSFFHLGLCLIPIIIASICTGIFTGFGADWVANWAAKKRGRRVPENQILNLILPTVCGLVGSIIFGLAGANPGKYPWPVFLFGLGLMAFGFLGANTIGAVYVLESYPHLAGPALVNIASFRCLIAFVLSFRVSEWIADFGYFNTAMIFLGLMILFSLFLPVIYIYGPAWRRRWPANWAHRVQF